MKARGLQRRDRFNTHRAVSFRRSRERVLRVLVNRNALFRKTVHVIKALFWLGPLRSFAIRYYQLTTKQRRLLRGTADSCLTKVALEHAANRLRLNGWAPVGVVNTDYVDRLIRYCEGNQIRFLRQAHLLSNDVLDIGEDAQILNVAERYLGVSPILYASHLYWSYASEGAGENGEDCEFHFDVGDWKSVTLFVYLTDVDEASGPHALIEGTHGPRTVFRLMSRFLTAREAKEHLGNRVRTITGPRGTAFLEDLTCFHKRNVGSKSRLVLSITYTMHRRPVADG